MYRLLLLITLLAAGCSAKADGPPEILVDRTACAHCTMLISDRQYAAAFQPTGGEARVFDDIGCLLDAVSREATPNGARFWFHDVQSGEWVRGEDAVFVKSSQLKTPMNGGIVAYRNLQDAGRAARERQGMVVRSLSELLALGKQESGK